MIVDAADTAEEAAVRDDDPVLALCHLLQITAHKGLAASRCLSEAAVGARPELAQQKERMVSAAQLLLHRAQQRGQVRADLSLEEVISAVTQLGRPLPGASWAITERLSPRMVQLYLDGLFAPDSA
ncbi:SbtR family transcriptional regulator [Streptomyces chartreusis]